MAALPLMYLRSVALPKVFLQAEKERRWPSHIPLLSHL